MIWISWCFRTLLRAENSAFGRPKGVSTRSHLHSQVEEALKVVTDVGELLTNQLLMFNAKTMAFRKSRFQRNPACPICSEHPRITKLVDEKAPVCDLRNRRKGKI
mgnify:CR=1 FL=1